MTHAQHVQYALTLQFSGYDGQHKAFKVFSEVRNADESDTSSACARGTLARQRYLNPTQGSVRVWLGFGHGFSRAWGAVPEREELRGDVAMSAV